MQIAYVGPVIPVRCVPAFSGSAPAEFTAKSEMPAHKRPNENPEPSDHLANIAKE